MRSAGYADGVLEIEFVNGSVYRYFGVSAEVAKTFMESESKGQYFVRFIRGRYEFEEAKHGTTET